MMDFLQGKFEFRLWLAIVLMVITVLCSFLGDQSTFVHSPTNLIEKLLTLLPTLSFILTEDRTLCFVIALAVYGSLLGGMGLGALLFLERYVFEPLFFKRMIQTKRREEQLFNHYLNQSKP